VPVCNKIIVVEGPDGAGKSTLCKNLQEHFKWPIIHGGGPLTSRNDFLDRNRTKGWNDLESKICDRVSYISERVYAKNPLVSSLETNLWVGRVKPVIIFCCLDTSEEMLEKMTLSFKAHKSADMEMIKKEHPEIVRKYKVVMSTLRHAYFNWNRHDIRNLITQINMQIL
jgi:hypothetical protein